MTASSEIHPLIRAEEAKAKEDSFSHPWNPKSQVIGTALGKLAGLQRTGVNFVRVPPGKESFMYHTHTCEEEWIYILSGEGVAEIDGAEHKVGPGDFMGFPTPSVAHHMRNDGTEDLVYLMGGESRDLEVADFPKLGKRIIRQNRKAKVYNIKDGKDFGPLDEGGQ
jgi:uncharacterized cupin superfamily protein